MKLEAVSLKCVSMTPKHDVAFAVLEAKYFLGSYIVASLDDNQATLSSSLSKTVTSL